MFAHGAPTGFAVTDCSDNPYSDWIGAQIRADMYGWVCPGQPDLAADLARRDASLSHRGAGADGAAFVAAFGAAIPVTDTLEEACVAASAQIPQSGGAWDAVRFAKSLVGERDAVERIHERFKALPPIHTLNNLAVVVWAILSHSDDYSAAVGEAVAAGWDTDCNGATVGGLWGLTGRPVPEHWTAPWGGRVSVTLAGVGELDLNDLVARTVAMAHQIAAERRV
jgi:ADP-ribosylglycohydrolase